MLTGWRAEVHRANTRQAIAHVISTTLLTWILVALVVAAEYLLGYDVAAPWHGYSGLTWIAAGTLTWSACWWGLRFYVKRFTQPPKTEWHDGLLLLLPLLLMAAVAEKIRGK